MARQSTLTKFKTWAAKAKPGTSFTYHASWLGRRPTDVFEYARGLSDDGRVMLFQARDNDHPFAALNYLAVYVRPETLQFVKEATR